MDTAKILAFLFGVAFVLLLLFFIFSNSIMNRLDWVQYGQEYRSQVQQMVEWGRQMEKRVEGLERRPALPPPVESK